MALSQQHSRKAVELRPGLASPWGVRRGANVTVNYISPISDGALTLGPACLPLSGKGPLGLGGEAGELGGKCQR